ncbi:MAG: hypothetical protein MRY77_02925 [Rhodobacteraceae bacterium]|nr:hypothetical protein [Paracoccaceae bacterium]
MNDLDERLLAAHAAGEDERLVALYTEAADTANDQDAACFFLTHAYIFALEQNHPALEDLRNRLVAAGRETP